MVDKLVVMEKGDLKRKAEDVCRMDRQSQALRHSDVFLSGPLLSTFGVARELSSVYIVLVAIRAIVLCPFSKRLAV